MFRTLENLVKFVRSKDLKDKDIFENDARCQMLYLGDNDFENKYNFWTKLQRSKIEEDNITKRNELIKKKTEDESISNLADYMPDANELFLKSFPGLSLIYSKNKDLKRKGKSDPLFSIERGNYSPPTCCSLIVVLFQFVLTYLSVITQKG